MMHNFYNNMKAGLFSELLMVTKFVSLPGWK